VTINEARAFLNADAYDDLGEAYEQLLFDQKQYFLLKPCIPKVYASKIEKIKLFKEASKLLQLEGEEKSSVQQIRLSEVSLIELYRTYSEQLNAIKRLISLANTFEQLEVYANDRCALFCEYASKWPPFSEFRDDLLLSSEPDPMEFFQELKHLESNGISTFASLVDSDEQLGVLVKKESTRLHLVCNSK